MRVKGVTTSLSVLLIQMIIHGATSLLTRARCGIWPSVTSINRYVLRGRIRTYATQAPESATVKGAVKVSSQLLLMRIHKNERTTKSCNQ